MHDCKKADSTLQRDRTLLLLLLMLTILFILLHRHTHTLPRTGGRLWIRQQQEGGVQLQI
jgi:hypothetical protein